MNNSEKDLQVQKIIKAPPSAVWQAWKKPEYLAKWWAPAPFQTIVNKLELKPGGAFNTVMVMEDGTEHGGEGCFLEIVENQRIVFTDALQGGYRPNESAFFTSIITLEEHPEGTLYTATALHKNDKDRQQHVEMGFIEGWSVCIDQLGEIAENLTSKVY